MKVARAVFLSSLVAAMFAAGDYAQQAPQPQPATQPRNLWIARFACDTKAAAAVAATQREEADALEYSNLFATVATFEKLAEQPKGTWSLTAKEVEFYAGSAAKRALLGYGAGRQSITMEYTLTSPDGKLAWQGKIKTKPSFFGSVGAVGAVQNQGAAEGQQAQKLIAALSKFFGGAPAGKHS